MASLMLPGVSGTLLSPTFLEQLAAEQLVQGSATSGVLRRVLQWWRRAERTLGPAASLRFIADTAAIPFFEAHGYHVVHLEPHSGALVGVLARAESGRLAIRIARWGSDLDLEWRDTVRASRVSGARWGVVFTGGAIRVVDAARTWSRRGVEFDLTTALRHERSALALLAIIDAAAEAPRGASLEQLVSRSEQLGVEVCASLGTGVLDALGAIFRELTRARRTRHSDTAAAFEQALTIVYRLLFLLFAEARNLVPTWHHIYRDGYTIETLCRRALAQPSRPGLWRTLQAISRLAHVGCRAGELIVTPFNGRLFSPHHTPLGERLRLADPAVATAVIALATTARNGRRERIAYADLGVEQLGAVYERVLEYEPAPQAGPEPLARTSLERKSTGSFYTPRAITDFLVRRALQPLVAGKRADEILALRVLDPAMGSGAFLVAACRYLADAVERALVDEGECPPAATRADRAAIRRLVAQRCLYGVDLNPMAVQLARLSLWLASLSADRPLTFLDHHLVVGDSLIGAWLADLTRTPHRARRRFPGTITPLFEVDPAIALATEVLPTRFRLAHDADTAASVQDKERALAALHSAGAPLARWKDAADLWCASWFLDPPLSSGAYHDVFAELIRGAGTLPDHHRAAMLARAHAAAQSRRFLHWELEFPEAFFQDDGRRVPGAGFDAVIGNPPWEVLRADAGGRAHRDRTRAGHRAGLRFFRDSGVYRCQGTGHANQYQLFVERALQLTRAGGRLALIVPSGLASDHGSRALRAALFERVSIERLFGFDNRMSIFPIHRDVRFLLLTATAGGATHRISGRFAQSDAQWLDQLPDDAAADPASARAITISRAALESWDPEGRSLPWLASAIDLEILATVSSRIPQLGTADGWHVRFGRELNATEDRRYFVTPQPAAAGLLPVIEGKQLEPFRVLIANSTSAVPATRAATLVDERRTFARARIAYRDVASATNRLTLIAARLPPGTISTHTVFCSRDSLGADAQYCLLALLNSLVANYLVRLRVTTHVTSAVMARLCVPRPSSTSTAFRELAALARSLEQTGLTGGEIEYARLNAIAANLYGITSDQHAHIVSTFPLLVPGRATETRRAQRNRRETIGSA